MKKLILKSVVSALVFCMTVTSFAFAASNITKNIRVNYAGIKLNVNGAEVTPKDANGATVEPFIYNGTPYLPVRAVGTALGQQVSWDGNSKTVFIGSNLGQSTFLMDVCPPYEARAVRNKNGSFTMAGKTYGHGFDMYRSTDAYAYFNLNGNYRTMEFDFGACDGDNEREMNYEIYLDGQLVKTITHEPGEMVKHYTVSLNNALQMKIVGAGGEGYSDDCCGFANITVK